MSPSLSDESGPLPQFLASAVEEDDLLELDEEEQEELTIRRIFEPKRPARVAVEISDADATWKWERPRADAQGQFVGLALPLDEVEFDHSEAEVTREMMSPFALTAGAARNSAIPLSAARRRPRVARAKAKRPSFLARNYKRALVVVAAAVVAFAAAFVLGRGSQQFKLGTSAGIGQVATTAIDLPPIADVPLHGTIVPTVKGHRLYVDGKLIGDSNGPVTVDCGTRIVKLGTAGVTKSVAVPCGGEISVAP